MAAHAARTRAARQSAARRVAREAGRSSPVFAADDVDALVALDALLVLPALRGVLDCGIRVAPTEEATAYCHFRERYEEWFLEYG